MLFRSLSLDTFYGSEETFTADLGPVILSGRIDELHIEDIEAEIIDSKSNYVIPSAAKVAEDFQLKTYGYLVTCKFPKLETVKGIIYLPRYGIFSKTAEWDREELERWGEHLERLVKSLETATKLEAMPGLHCQYCPASLPGGGCPAWRKTYGLESVIRSEREAVEAAKQIMGLEQRLKARRTVLQGWCKEQGHVRAGSREFGYWESESQIVRAAMLPEALAGTDLDPYDYLGISAAALKKLKKALGKDADTVIEDISDVKKSTRFAEKAIGTDE